MEKILEIAGDKVHIGKFEGDALQYTEVHNREDFIDSISVGDRVEKFVDESGVRKLRKVQNHILIPDSVKNSSSIDHILKPPVYTTAQKQNHEPIQTPTLSSESNSEDQFEHISNTKPILNNELSDLPETNPIDQRISNKQNPTEQVPTNQESNSKKKKTILLATLGVFVAILIIAGIFLFNGINNAEVVTIIDHELTSSLINKETGKVIVTNNDKSLCSNGQKATSCLSLEQKEYDKKCEGKKLTSSSQTVCDNYLKKINDGRSYSYDMSTFVITNAKAFTGLDSEKEKTDEIISNNDKVTHQEKCYFGKFGRCLTDTEKVYNRELTQTEQTYAYNNSLTDYGIRLLKTANLIVTNKKDVAENCPVTKENQTSWLFIGCFNNKRLLVTDVQFPTEGEKYTSGKKIGDDAGYFNNILAGTQNRAFIYSMAQVYYDTLTSDEKLTLKNIIDQNYSEVSDYVKNNVKEDLLANNGDQYRNKFANIAGWDADKIEELKKYYEKFVQIYRVSRLYDIVDGSGYYKYYIKKYCTKESDIKKYKSYCENQADSYLFIEKLTNQFKIEDSSEKT